MIIDFGQSNEKYKCYHCGTGEINEKHIDDNWECKTCHNKIEILLEINGNKYVVNRIKAEELTPGLLFAFFDSIHKIFNVSVAKDDRIKLALEGYGTVKKDKDVFINIVRGSGLYW